MPLVPLVQLVLISHAQMRQNLNDFCLSYVMKLDQVAKHDHELFEKKATSSKATSPNPTTVKKEVQSDNCLIS